MSLVLWGHDYQAAVTDSDVSSASELEDPMRAAHICVFTRIIWFDVSEEASGCKKTNPKQRLET